jgi:hypothetical protein
LVDFLLLEQLERLQQVQDLQVCQVHQALQGLQGLQGLELPLTLLVFFTWLSVGYWQFSEMQWLMMW